VNQNSLLPEPTGNICFKKAGLLSKNITILKKRTSIRLEREMWDALFEIAEREGCSIHEICSLVYIRKASGSSLTAAIRVFIMLYFKAASTEQGHAKAGHGDFSQMKIRAKVSDMLSVSSVNAA
jgi:predicted DNA-binding ribbon-helix-helix protein